MRFAVLVGMNIFLTLGWMENSVAIDEVSRECPSLLFMEGHKEYSRKVCAGDGFFQLQEFDKAVVEYENALALPLHETPNFELLPQLALTYFKLRKMEHAHQIIGASELSLQIFAGGAKCIEAEAGYEIDVPNIERFSLGIRKLVSHRMCGAAYDTLYAQGTFRHSLIAAELIKKHKEVEEQIGFRLR